MGTIIRVAASAILLCLASSGTAVHAVETDSAATGSVVNGGRPGPQFEETTPPRWTPESGLQIPEDSSDDPLMQKIRDTNAELDRAAQPAPETRRVTERASEGSFTFYLLKAVVSLLLVLSLIFLLAYLAKRYGSRSPIFAGPALAKVMGKVHLGPRTYLYYVHSGGRVLVIGVAPNAISVVAEFDAASFEDSQERENASPVESNTEEPVESSRFLTQLRAGLAATKRAETSPDEEIDALKKEVERLQQYLLEGAREEKV